IRLKFAPLLIARLLRRLLRTASAVTLLLRKTALKARFLLRWPRARRLLRMACLGLWIDPGRLPRTLRICGAGSGPSSVRPWKCVLRGHRENPSISGAEEATPNRRFETLAHRVGRLDPEDFKARFYHRLCRG